MSVPQPAMRYERKGDAYIDLLPEIAESAVAPLVRLSLTHGLPTNAFEWEPGCGTLWVHWQCAQAAERQFRAMWPDAPVTAEANPGYGVRAARIMERQR